MSEDEILFFSFSAGALPIYEHFRSQVTQRFPETEIKVSKTQISFKARSGYACVALRRM